MSNSEEFEMIEEFEKDASPYGYNLEKANCGCCEYLNISTEHRWRGFKAATEASDARYQARIRELEEALITIELRFETDGFAEQALATTSPDQALQRAILEARIDELDKTLGMNDEWQVARLAELRAKRNEIGG